MFYNQYSYTDISYKGQDNGKKVKPETLLTNMYNKNNRKYLQFLEFPAKAENSTRERTGRFSLRTFLLLGLCCRGNDL